MSECFVPVVEIEDKKPHPNADRLEFVKVLGWWVATHIDEYQVGDGAIYFPVDSLLPR